jgi:hypothetical protein
MWRATGRIERLIKALEFREVDSKRINIHELEGILIKRGITDTKLCGIYSVLLHYLEPKSCQMYHCEHYGIDGFCNCCKNLVPSKCKKHRDFLKRCKAKAVKAADWLLEIKESRYNDLPVNFDMSTYEFFTGLEKVPGFELVEKWSYRLKEDVWKEVKRRAFDLGIEEK